MAFNVCSAKPISGTQTRKHTMPTKKPARCWSRQFLTTFTQSSSGSISLDVMFPGIAAQCLSYAMSFVLLSLCWAFPPQHDFVFECASWSCGGSLIGAHSTRTHRNKLSFPTPQLSKYCPGNFVIPARRREKCLWGCFSSFLLMLPSFSRCFVHRAFLERSRWSSGLFTGGSEPKWDWTRLSSLAGESSSSSLDSSSRKLAFASMTSSNVATKLSNY